MRWLALSIWSQSVPLHSVEKVGGARHYLGSNGEKNREHKTVSQHNILIRLILLCNIFQTGMLHTVVLDSLGIFEDLQIWHSSLFYLGSLLCSGWWWCWLTRGAKAIKVTKIPKIQIHKTIQKNKGIKSNLLGIIQIILKVNFNHSEECPAGQKGVRASL